MTEIWKDIEGYEGLYQVSNLGNIRSLTRTVNSPNGKRTIQGQLIKPRINRRNGYVIVNLHKDGVSTTFRLHRLVAFAFVNNPNPNSFKEINHKDEILTNNCADNLEWCDSKYNKNYGNHNRKMALSKSKAVYQYDLDFNFIKEWESLVQIERELGFQRAAISRCCKGKQKTSYGYKWRFKEGEIEC